MELLSLRSLGSGIPFTGSSFRLTHHHGILSRSPVKLPSRPRTGGDFTIFSKSSSGNSRRRGSRPAGKSSEQKLKEFAVRKEEQLRKSRGQVSVAERGILNEEHVVENDAGALSVSVLQPIDDQDYNPVTDASVQKHLDNSLASRFSDFVAKKNAAREGSKDSTSGLDEQPSINGQVAGNGIPRSRIEHAISRRVDKEISRADAEEKEGDEEDEEEEEDEWIEVGLDDADGEEEEEILDYWEGDLPPMTPEEEEELLREAELELAELEKTGQPGGDHDLEEVPYADSTGVQMQQKITGLKTDNQLAGSKGETENPSLLNSNGHAKSINLSVGKFEIESTERKPRDGEILDLEQQQATGQDEEIRIESKRLSLTTRRFHRQDFWDLDDEDEDDDEVKGERGIPAVMRCFDRAKIYVKAGDGGNGVVAFRREKYVPFGGPFGGNGGRGGHVYIETDPSMNSLLPFRKTVHFRAGRGAHGGGKRKEGAVGVDTTIRVPLGTVIRESGPDGKVLLEMIRPGEREMLLPGGTGGRGNAAFKTGRNNAPQLAELGEEGPEMWIDLELKLVADVGIIGVPNAGKSTLLSAISAAKPEIANYPFTTLLPNLGVVALDYDTTMVVADLPGLLEGAHTGLGLGHEFLRHTERCRVLVHIVDGLSPQPEEEFEAVRLELQLFNPILSEKPFVVAFNKMDIPEAADRWNTFEKQLLSKGLKPLCMSAATQQGSSQVISAAYDLLKLQKESEIANPSEEEMKAMAVAELVRQQRSVGIETFTIKEDKHTRTWQVVGVGLERFTQMTNWEYFEAVRRFQRVLSASGVNKALREKGIREGDTVIVGQMEFSWLDSEDMSSLSDWKRGVRGSKVWPH